MSKGQETREKILDEALVLFNTQGYQNTSFKDLTERTGVQKGGIYNHFSNKEQLTLDVFDRAIAKMRARSRQILQNQHHTIDRIKGVVAVFQSFQEDPIIEGGCIIMNTTVEADDTHPALLERSREAMEEWRGYIIRCAEKGIDRAEIQSHVNPEALASVVLGSLEGGVLMSRIYDDNTHFTHMVNYLNSYLDGLRMENNA